MGRSPDMSLGAELSENARASPGWERLQLLQGPSDTAAPEVSQVAALAPLWGQGPALSTRTLVLCSSAMVGVTLTPGQERTYLGRGVSYVVAQSDVDPDLSSGSNLALQTPAVSPTSKNARVRSRGSGVR